MGQAHVHRHNKHQTTYLPAANTNSPPPVPALRRYLAVTYAVALPLGSGPILLWTQPNTASGWDGVFRMEGRRPGHRHNCWVTNVSLAAVGVDPAGVDAREHEAMLRTLYWHCPAVPVASVSGLHGWSKPVEMAAGCKAQHRQQTHLDGRN